MDMINNDELIAILTVITATQHQTLLLLQLLLNDHRRIEHQPSYIRHRIRKLTFFRLLYESDLACRESTRMDRRCFHIFCSMLRTIGGLVGTEYVDVEEMVAMFLHILAHDVKNEIICRQFVRSGETVSRHFNTVLCAVLRLHEVLLKKPTPITNSCTDERWKWFENCLGALDGTYFNVNNVSVADRQRYKNRKGDITTNVLAVCSTSGEFIFVMPGWEGSATDSRVLRDAISRPSGLKVPKGYYYLCDFGYPNAEGFLAPYRGERYHLFEWNEGGNAPNNSKEFFNMKHSSARNVIERTFNVLKERWVILRGNSFYSVQTQCRTITACCLIHNLISREMGPSVALEEWEEESSTSSVISGGNISFIESSKEWNKQRDEMAKRMFANGRQS